MKKILLIFILFASIGLNAQNYTVKELSRRTELTVDSANNITYTTIFVTVKYTFTDLNKTVTVEVANFAPKNEAEISKNLNNRALTEYRKLKQQ